MKLSCLQENLNTGLNIVRGAITTKNSNPILKDVLLSTDGSRLKLMATDTVLTITCWVPAKIETEGAIVIPAKLLSDFVESLPSDRVDLELAPPMTLSIHCARMHGRINGIKASDFPKVTMSPDRITTKVNSKSLCEAINLVKFATSPGNSNPVLSTVNFKFEGNQLTLAAADGFRLAVSKLTLEEPIVGITSLNVPIGAINEVSHFSNQVDTIEIAFNKKEILFRHSSVEIQSALLEGSYPQYSRLIPTSSSTTLTIETLQFLRAVKLAMAVDGTIRLIVEPDNSVTITSKSDDDNDDTSRSTISANIVGNPLKIAFSGKYLVDVLNELKTTKTVELCLAAPTMPAIIKSDNYEYVIMPIAVPW